MATPKVSVLLPAFNAGGERASELRLAIESILLQSFTDFELLLIDDGSKDNTTTIFSEYRGESRIRFLALDRNRGLVPALNHGIRHSRGQYLARMDADDISLAHRLKKQVDFLDKNPGVQICGSHFTVIDRNGFISREIARPSTNSEIRNFILREGSPFAHPSVIFRREILDRVGFYSYDPRYRYADDFEYWTRILNQCRGANIAQSLIQYRDAPNPNRIGSGSFHPQMAAADHIQHKVGDWFRLPLYADWVQSRLGKSEWLPKVHAEEITRALCPISRLREFCSGNTLFLSVGYGSILFTQTGAVSRASYIVEKPEIAALVEERQQLHLAVNKGFSAIQPLKEIPSDYSDYDTLCLGHAQGAGPWREWIKSLRAHGLRLNSQLIVQIPSALEFEWEELLVPGECHYSLDGKEKIICGSLR